MKRVRFVLVFFFITACVSTDIASFTDPDYRNFKIRNIAVIADVADLRYKITMENDFASCFRDKRLNVYEGYNLVPPTRNYKPAEIKEIFRKNNVHAVLLFTIQDAGYTQEQVTLYAPYNTSGTINRTGANQFQYSSTTQGGPMSFNVKKPHLTMKTHIFDPSNGRLMWIATSFSSGNAFVNLESTIYNYVISVVDRLEADDLLAGGPEPNIGEKSEEKTPLPIEGEKSEKQFVEAKIGDIPAGVRAVALREMTEENLKAVIKDMPRPFAQSLTIETVRMIHKYNLDTKK